jgi:hypothetical protein
MQRETEEVWKQKVRLGLIMQSHAMTRYKWGFLGSGSISKKVLSHHSVVTSKAPTWLDVTQLLFLKR